MNCSLPRIPILFFVILIALIFPGGCAKQASPPGGPEDTTPPSVTEAIPAAGTTNVSPDTRVEVLFSEALSSTTVEKALFITPQPEGTPKVKVKGNRIIIEFEKGLDSNKTYVISLGVDLQDVHRVNLDKSITLAFSTGPVIDSGKISGSVYKDNKAAVGINLALFTEDPALLSSVIDSLVPEYQTQSGQGGLYTFEYLPPGRYYLVAFEDKNKNRRINFGSEMIGLPWREVILDEKVKSLTDRDIQLTDSDTAQVALKAVSVNQDNLLKVRFNRPLDSVYADKYLNMIEICRYSDSTVIGSLQAFINTSDYPCDEFLAIANGLDDSQDYYARIDRGIENPQISDSLRYSSFGFNNNLKEDVSPPRLIRFSPADKSVNVVPNTSLELVFSEEMDSIPVPDALVLISTDNDTIRAIEKLSGPFTCIAQPEKELSYGMSYNLIIDAVSFRDKSGNMLGDSALVYKFNTIGLDTLGSLSGTVSFTNPEDKKYPVILNFTASPGGVSKIMELYPEQSVFSIDLMPGLYTASAYLDKNGNGRYDFGSIIPYRLAEPFIPVSDTTRVRSRFESAGTTLKFK